MYHSIIIFVHNRKCFICTWNFKSLWHRGLMYLISFLVDRSDSQTLQKFAKRGKGMKRRFTWRVVTTSYTGVHLINSRILINISLNTNWLNISITHQKEFVSINSVSCGAFWYLDNLHSKSGINLDERKHLNVIV